MHTSLQYVKMLTWIFIAPFVLAISHSQMTNAYKFSMHTHRLNRPVKRNRLAFTGRDVGIDHNLSDDRTLLRTWPIERFSRHQSLWRWEPIAWLWASPGGQVAVAEGYRICHVFLIHPYKASFILTIALPLQVNDTVISRFVDVASLFSHTTAFLSSRSKNCC